MKFRREWSTPWRALMLLSLCVNVALFTYVSAQWLLPGGFRPGAAVPLRMIERVAERLPAEDAEILWSIYRGKEAELAPLQAEYRLALMKAMKTAAQTNLDKAELEAAVKDARDKRVKIGDLVVSTFVEMLERISAKGRRQLVGGYFR
ncbi:MULTISPECIES: periplasmic heavy metal sensor [unclassified Bradyrhizobium]|uniref:periplasmic heavy metal sensor n=1 Tax=unclassified Bradyrhizobium TaxID=2631580 RepID=UPI001CD60C3F|nr:MULTISPECIES: periplasmic heavy metal sensor [unclassified Bradyrhizobium]MCA1385717.1 periplasmic heavy metal sensor [Bradyrhizobium sp. BRP05]MCA1364755.1 periplasmic heavy metal sensor [Bradyrhizobium sp. IC4059]MCA1393959.1 periplasmic heavy metal sensor [Bradyrhizobium sp. IC3123]MCA1422481.1 periplasmic heavy metal sensor [Bradyrhizobium sp. BRP23]MCA1501678.1 periplasmic heavy metal sensor [Bradyrhizobium sp. NBAIM14]